MLSAPRREAALLRLLGSSGDARGSTAVEYGLLASLIGLALVAGLTPLGTAIGNVLLRIAGAL